ncbi:S-layer homology domain-containing protein [Domibacillus epiphyticus]|uniref:SLH domain-containing protein n=1 Tax=Domibacillus epiphyticus TaxID=1714355 RepID=A0A1V2A689_9BACI|nr:S-layer homology domain-containing protein [Domibacillus epiphyticus]OMP66496.1 hypothetical protein BTO28_12435 [Domibacillus epiphyticus]
MEKKWKGLFAILLSAILLIPIADQASASELQGTSSGTAVQATDATISAAAKKFRDVPSNFWAKEEIDYLVQSGIISGYKNGHFGVKDAVKREHAAIILAKALDIQNESAPNPGFRDIPTSHPAYKSIAVLTKYGVFSKAKYFNPSAKLKRSQMAKIIAESFGLEPTYIVTFKDVKRTDWFYDYVSTLGSAGIAGGSNGYFKPNSVINRTEFSVFVARALEAKFRTGVQVDIKGASYESDGRIKMTLTVYNNSQNKVFNIKGEYTLYAGNTVVADMPSPRLMQGVVINPNQQKTVTVYFARTEVKQRPALQNLTLDYEHAWSYYK